MSLSVLLHLWGREMCYCFKNVPGGSKIFSGQNISGPKFPGTEMSSGLTLKSRDIAKKSITQKCSYALLA